MTPTRRRFLYTIVIPAVVGALAGAWLVRPSVHLDIHLPLAMKLSIGLWFLFSVYWSIAAKDQAATKLTESVLSRQLHLFLINGALLLLIFPVPGLTRRFLPESPWLIGAGLTVQSAFILFAVWARRSLGSNWSGEVRIATEHQLVRSGPYHFVRHPIYTALLGMYFGTMLVSGQIHAPIALGLVTLAYWRKLHLEERVLTETFGADYEAYRQESWALIPGLY